MKRTASARSNLQEQLDLSSLRNSTETSQVAHPGQDVIVLVIFGAIVPQTTPVVEMQDLTMQWGSVPVLNKVNLKMQPGERLAIVGPSGCGKSTVLRLLAGLILPTSGDLNLFGKNQVYLRLDQSYPPDVRLVFQNPALLASLTVEENVGFLLMRSGELSHKNIQNLVSTCLEEVGLYDVADKFPGQLSGGMQKRVSFARALINDPYKKNDEMPLLLYDEPTAGLDPMACTRIEDLIVKTTKVAKGCSIIVSHVRSTIERSASRVLMLYGGKFRWDGSIEEFRQSDNHYVEQFRTGSLHGPMQPADN